MSAAGGRRADRRGSRRGPEPTVSVRRRRWRPGTMPLRVDVPSSGIEVGVDRSGSAVRFPLLVPMQSTRVGVVGDPVLARLLALRLLEQSAELAVVTEDATWWQRLGAERGAAITVLAPTQRPPERRTAPWALVVEAAAAPAVGDSRMPWSTVVHVVPQVPSGSPWWQSAHLVLADAEHARGVAAIRPRLAPGLLAGLRREDVVAVDHTGVQILRPALRDHERALLTSVS